MTTQTIPRTHNDSLIDFGSPHLGAYLTLKSCLEDEIGDIAQEQENAIWTMVQEHNISYKQAQDFAQKKATERKKRALDDWWQSAIFNK